MHNDYKLNMTSNCWNLIAIIYLSFFRTETCQCLPLQFMLDIFDRFFLQNLLFSSACALDIIILQLGSIIDLWMSAVMFFCQINLSPFEIRQHGGVQITQKLIVSSVLYSLGCKEFKSLSWFDIFLILFQNPL